ncbi:hypothetical protein H3N56_10320 [Cetobacterium sp. 2A]|uniref:hypothetical protein n=1 Tax=Cetobacterium sp. 2A TaxID=2754723 RepID=UPI00163BE270|nr:hypothetical protein [Cetobacterium sp. 2A]MBC2855224.1 hypothetical protein [Cetobacterium sp. 2A]MBC2855273.1 hypothetical protein [Cetobacterium sp. 2A]MBC2855641.1 hypothetical protein [Cetobacterium sp. 2A]MBC2856835.1 hypothetical protein [Cetobacterium sp. 2A]
MKNENLVGRTWGSFTEAEKNELLKNSDTTEKTGDTIVDFENGLSIVGFLREGTDEVILEIADEAVVYNPVA